MTSSAFSVWRKHPGRGVCNRANIFTFTFTFFFTFFCCGGEELIEACCKFHLAWPSPPSSPIYHSISHPRLDEASTTEKQRLCCTLLRAPLV